MGKKVKSVALNNKTLKKIERYRKKDDKESFSETIRELVRDRLNQMETNPQKELLKKKQNQEEEVIDLLEQRKEVMLRLINLGLEYEKDAWIEKELMEKLESIQEVIENKEGGY